MPNTLCFTGKAIRLGRRIYVGSMPHSVLSEDWPKFCEELGLRIQRERVSQGLSQEYVAYNAGLSRFSYQQLEKGQSRPGTPANPSLHNIMAVAQVLDVSIDAFLGEKYSWPDFKAK